MTNRNMKLIIKSMRYIDYCYSNYSYEKQALMTASFLEGSSQTNRNIKLIIKSMIHIDYYDSNYCYKKQVPMTVSFLEGFYFSLKTLEEACYMLLKVSQFPLTLASKKLRMKHLIFKWLFGYSMILIPFGEKKTENHFPKKLRWDDSPLRRSAKLQSLQLCHGTRCWNYYNFSNFLTNKERIF